MQRVTGLGGIFFKAHDPKKLGAWYKEYLGLPVSEEWGGCEFHWREKDKPDRTGYTVWSPFSENTKYFDPSKSSFMVNFRVDNLAAVLEQLRKEGVQVEDMRRRANSVSSDG